MTLARVPLAPCRLQRDAPVRVLDRRGEGAEVGVARCAVAVRRMAGPGSTSLYISMYVICDVIRLSRFNRINHRWQCLAGQHNLSSPYPTLASFGLSLMHSVYCSTASR